MTQETNVMRTLRALVPKRPLAMWEAERIAELQANRLRELSGNSGPHLVEEVLSSQPRIRVERDFDLSVSGLAFWLNGYWIIRLNAGEPNGRQRFSLAHEYKHILDHTTKESLYPRDSRWSPEEKAEYLGDFFAGCLLMPKRHVKRLFGERRPLRELAQVFDVTPRAMAVRLSQLGLTESSPRCSGSLDSGTTSDVYHRTASSKTGVAA